MAKNNELAAMEAVFAALEPLTADERGRALAWVTQKLGLPSRSSPGGSAGEAPTSSAPGSSSSADVTPKVFVSQRRPNSDIQRVAALAYYLTHARGVTQFETKDLTKLNSEAAQRAFSNSAYAVANAVKADYLAGAGGRKKQITTRGEALVEALPDQSAVRAALEANPAGGRRRSGAKRRVIRRRDKSAPK
jgi:hypothetical protein